MGLFRRLNRIAADARRAEESLYAMAADEVANGDVKPGLWAKAFAESNGEEVRTQAAYLKLRVLQMRDELAALERAVQRCQKEWADTDRPLDARSPASHVDSQSDSDAVANSEPSTIVPVSDQAIESLATSRTISSWWAMALTVLLLFGVAAVLIVGSDSDVPRGSSQSNQTPAHIATEVRRLIQEGRPQEAYGLAHRYSSQQLRDEAWAAIRNTSVEKPVTTTPSRPITVFTTGESHALIPADTDAVATIAGTLSIEPVETQHALMLDGQRLDLPESYLDFLSLTRYTDQDIVLVSMNCGGSACTFLDLAFVRLFANRPPVLETLPEFQFPSDIIDDVQQAISLRGDAIDVALGLTGGAYWFATISPTDDLAISTVSAPIEPLSDDDCRLAAEMLDYCTELRTPCEEASFRDFPWNCPDATLPLYRATRYLVRHTTGLNLPAFAQACASASKLSMIPSQTFIESEICSGADPSQWESTDALASTAAGIAAAP